MAARATSFRRAEGLGDEPFALVVLDADERHIRRTDELIAATADRITGGVDEETDDELRARVLQRIRKPPMGGSADLGPSNNTALKGEASFSAREVGRNFHWGVREHGMGAALNGMAAYGGLRAYGGEGGGPVWVMV